MDFDVEAAKADGYTDEEIRQYLATKDQPLPPEQPRDRTEEMLGTGTSSVPTAVSVGLGGYGAYKIGKGLINAASGAMGGNAPPAPRPVPTTFTGGANPAWDAALAKPHPMSTPLPPEPPTASNYIQRMTQLARTYAPIAARTAATAAVPATVAGTGAALSNVAANQVQAMTPQQRQQFYSSPMMGAMSGDTGFASAIMNAGQ